MPVAPSGLGLVPALLFGGGQRRSRLHAQRRCRMQRTSAPESGCGSTATAGTRNSGTAHDGLAGTNGTAINGLAGDRRRAARRHSRTRRLRLGLTRRGTRLLQPRNHIRARRDYRTGSRLACQIRPRSGPQRHRGRRACRFYSGRSGGTRRRRRHGRRDSRRWRGRAGCSETGRMGNG